MTDENKNREGGASRSSAVSPEENQEMQKDKAALDVELPGADASIDTSRNNGSAGQERSSNVGGAAFFEEGLEGTLQHIRRATERDVLGLSHPTMRVNKTTIESSRRRMKTLVDEVLEKDGGKNVEHWESEQRKEFAKALYDTVSELEVAEDAALRAQDEYKEARKYKGIANQLGIAVTAAGAVGLFASISGVENIPEAVNTATSAVTMAVGFAVNIMNFVSDSKGFKTDDLSGALDSALQKSNDASERAGQIARTAMEQASKTMVEQVSESMSQEPSR